MALSKQEFLNLFQRLPQADRAYGAIFAVVGASQPGKNVELVLRELQVWKINRLARWFGDQGLSIVIRVASWSGCWYPQRVSAVTGGLVSQA